jgi:hypothetical protein
VKPNRAGCHGIVGGIGTKNDGPILCTKYILETISYLGWLESRVLGNLAPAGGQYFDPVPGNSIENGSFGDCVVPWKGGLMEINSLLSIVDS